jgi:hypothetical protein
MRVFACNVVSKLQRNRCITFGDWRSRTNWPLQFYIYIYIYYIIYTCVYSKLLLVGLKLLYWAWSDRGLRYSVCTRICVLNICNVNIYVCTDKRLNPIDSDKRQTWPLVREGVPQRHDNNHRTVTNISSWEPEGARHQDILTDWPSVVTWHWLDFVCVSVCARVCVCMWRG